MPDFQVAPGGLHPATACATFPMNPFLPTADLGLCLLAAKHFRRQAKRLSSQFDGVRAAEDIEAIHRARVASRRLRAALRMFQDCMVPEVHARWQKSIRRITAALGGARDADVQIDFLCRELCDIPEPPLFPGVAMLLAKLEKERERLQPKVVKAVDKIERSGVIGEMRASLAALRGERVADKETPDLSAVFSEAERRIHAQLEELLAHEGGLANPDAKEEHHAMRIAVKRLRYTLEIVQTPFKGVLDEPVQMLKTLQTFLGDIHDCDVWTERLAAFSERQRIRTIKRFGHEGPAARLTVGLTYLQEARAGDRDALFASFVAYWNQLACEKAWDDLRRRASAGGATFASALPSPEGEASAVQHTTARLDNRLPEDGLAMCSPAAKD